MSIQRSPRVDRDTAERLAAGKGVGPVASVLRAAAAPAHRDELAGEDAAVAAFLAAPAAEPARQPVFRRAVAKALTIKVAIVLAIAGSTGVVLAASEGALPVPWSNSPAVPPPATTTTTAPPPAPSPSADRPSADRQPPADPDPAVVGLCQAYEAHEDRNLDNPAFRALVEAAGGKDEVTGYCEQVEAATPAPPTGPGKPDGAGEPGGPGRPGEPGEPGGPANPPARSERPGPPDRPGVTDPPTAPNQPAKPTKTSKTSKTKKKPTSEPTVEDAVARTPGSPAPGAATAVPPSGAEPPSTGG